MLVHLHMLAAELHMLVVEQISTLVEHLHKMVSFYIQEKEVDLKKLKPEYLN